MSRQLPDVIAAYLEYTDPTEPPLSYRLWAIISVISSVLERRCWMDWGYTRIYPNQYIVLVGPSGQTRKGEALRTARELLDITDVNLIAQKITTEALIRRMKEALSTFQNPEDGNVEYHSSVSCLSEELSVFLGQGEIGFLASLTDWYDCSRLWTYDTKNRDTDAIQGVCFNLLGATAPSWIPSMLPREAIGGGWTSRVIFVVEEYKGKIIPDPNAVMKPSDLFEKLAYDLSLIKTLTGPFTFSEEAKQVYMKWYNDYELDIKAGKGPVPDPRFAGYVARRATHVKKLGMAMSASRGDDQIITLNDFERARKVLTVTEAKAPKAFQGVGENKTGFACQLILAMIETSKGKRAARSEFLAAYYQDIDVWTLDRVIEALQGAKMIKVEIDLEARDTFYVPGENFTTEGSAVIAISKDIVDFKE